MGRVMLGWWGGVRRKTRKRITKMHRETLAESKGTRCRNHSESTQKRLREAQG